MADTESFSSPFANFNGTRHWKIWAFAAVMTLVAAGGTWIAGQYQIGRLDALRDRYNQPITDFAEASARARVGSMEADLLESCKQAQIGTWLQTTDALNFIDPVAGNRIVVQLDPSKSHLDLNGRELAICVDDEIENRQFDIGSMTNTWALVLFIISFGFAAWSWFGWEAWRRKTKGPATAEPSDNPVAEADEPPKTP